MAHFHLGLNAPMHSFFPQEKFENKFNDVDMRVSSNARYTVRLSLLVVGEKNLFAKLPRAFSYVSLWYGFVDERMIHFIHLNRSVFGQRLTRTEKNFFFRFAFPRFRRVTRSQFIPSVAVSLDQFIFLSP